MARMSAPAAKARSPAPVKMTARTAGWSPTSCSAPLSQSSCSGENALSASGLFIVTVAMPSLISTSIAIGHHPNDCPVFDRVTHVATRVLTRRGALIGRQLTPLPCRHAHYQRPALHDSVLWYERSRRHDGLIADRGAREHDCSHPDRYSMANRRSVNDCRVTDRHVIADDAWAPGVDVQHRAVLDVGAGTDAYWRNVTANDGVEPDARPGADLDVANDYRSRRNEYACCDSRQDVVERQQESLIHAAPGTSRTIASPPPPPEQMAATPSPP